MPYTSKAPRHLSGLRDARYGEILLISPDGGGALKAEVYNTLGLNDCPLERWKALDPRALAEEFQVPMVYLNGPRFWVVDEITAFAWGDTATFTGLEARLVAELRIPQELGLTDTKSKNFYVDATVERDTEYILHSGKPVHELLAPDSRTYVMQTYSHIVDDSLTIDSLAALGERLHLPQGWRYRVRTAEEDLAIRTVNGEAHVLQDELDNTYMLVPR
ncbi:hypothetical protein HYE82_11730 [Streptomyces sp. BR123]|uniref:hypothetical protein n=1 Tax=Streptomyces sp. BR123 TaxID=2749828 RepID=UPI0015C44784|nr:hypothetical protein [Streptomyces sp. BR123]NXY95053.1 hypothetical protein [Streptomyces sp. BR123]